jgi:hypothetical protein
MSVLELVKRTQIFLLLLVVLFNVRFIINDNLVMLQQFIRRQDAVFQEGAIINHIIYSGALQQSPSSSLLNVSMTPPPAPPLGPSSSPALITNQLLLM